MLQKGPEPENKINVAFILPDLKGKTLAEVAARGSPFLGLRVGPF
jgi:hypothetical protein